MTEEQFAELLACLGFGFGSLFWFLLVYVIFAWKGKSA